MVNRVDVSQGLNLSYFTQCGNHVAFSRICPALGCGLPVGGVGYQQPQAGNVLANQ